MYIFDVFKIMSKLLVRPRRVDANQVEIVAEFRRQGCSVLHLHTIGKGCPDILVGMKTSKYGKVNILVEIKDGSKPPSQRKLTPDEAQFHQDWLGIVATVTSLDDVRSLVNTLCFCS